MEDKLSKLKQEAIKLISQASDENTLKDIEVRFL